MTSVGTTGARRLRTAFTIAALAVSGIGLCGVASADPPIFNIQGYSTCTATTTPGPDQDFDGIVTSCCVQNAGIPTPSTYGMACVAAPPGSQSADYRPTIVLPTRPAPIDDGGLLGGPGDVNDGAFPGPPFGGQDTVGNPFGEGGPQ